MHVDLSVDFFELFGLPLEFTVDKSALTQRYRELQSQLHPDKFAASPDAERRWSLQAASVVNDGYQTLGSDLRRAVYLLTLNGVSVDEETDTHMAPEFLMQQMEYRESLEMAAQASDPMTALDKMKRQLKDGISEQVSAFADAAESSDWAAARAVVRQWQFLDKLSREVKSTEERLDV